MSVSQPSLARGRTKLRLILSPPHQRRPRRQIVFDERRLGADLFVKLVAFKAAIEAWTGCRVDDDTLLRAALAAYIQTHRAWADGPPSGKRKACTPSASRR